MTDSNINWEEMANGVIKKEEMTNIFTFPKPISANIYWKNVFYIGAIQEIVPEFSKEIVLLSKSSLHYPEELAKALRRLDSGRIELFVEDDLDLEGKQHIVRRIGDKVVHITTEQAIFIANCPMKIFEIR